MSKEVRSNLLDVIYASCWLWWWFPGCISSVVQTCPTLCFHVHHQLPELAHTHVHRVGDAIQPSHLLTSTFHSLESVLCSMSSPNCCFLTCIQISQEAGKVVCYSHLLKNSPWFVVIHTIKGFSVVNETEVDVFLELSCFFYDPTDVGNLIFGYSAFLKSSLNIWKFLVCILLKPS